MAELVYAYASGAYALVAWEFKSPRAHIAFVIRALPVVALAKTGYSIEVVYTLRVREAPVRFRVPRPVLSECEPFGFE